MTNDDQFLATEEAVHNLLTELETLRSASQQIGDATAASQKLIGTTESLVSGTLGLVKTGETVLTALADTALPETLAEIRQLALAISSYTSEVAARLEEHMQWAEEATREPRERHNLVTAQIERLGQDSVERHDLLAAQIERTDTEARARHNFVALQLEHVKQESGERYSSIAAQLKQLEHESGERHRLVAAQLERMEGVGKANRALLILAIIIGVVALGLAALPYVAG